LDGSQVKDFSVIETVCTSSDTRFIVGDSDSSLFPRLINRFGTSPCRVSTLTSEEDKQATNYKELLRRYRGVESVKFASVIGIVVSHCAASRELFQVRDVLASFLRAAGKEIYFFTMSRPDGVKLGNFPEIETFIIMTCPETPYYESSDLMADCVGPYEALVAMDAMEWSDYIVTDYDEMLAKMVSDPPPRTPRTPRQGRRRTVIFEDPNKVKLPPVKIQMGLRGIPSRYVSEPPS
jgi:diphthamide synthase subunit DPH2